MVVSLWFVVLSVAVLGSVLVQLLAPGAGLIAVLTGLFLVVGGTLMTASMSHSQKSIINLWRQLLDLRRSQALVEVEDEGFQYFLQAANCFRRGEIRPAESAIQGIEESLLRRGAQLAVDGFPRDQISLSLQRQIAEERNQLRYPAEMVRAMSGYAPAFGMLGTLLGLIQMLFGLGSGDLGAIGAAMGFAMLTTVYGLVLANLVLKPIASKLDEIGCRQITRRVAYLQAVLLMCDKQHGELIREMMAETEHGQEQPVANPTFELATSR